MKKFLRFLFIVFWLTLCVLAFYFTYSYLWAPHIHAYGEWSVTTPATCTAEGEQTRTCECGATDTRPIPATGHTMGDWQTTTPATCTAAGEQTRTCACGAAETQPIPATGHILSDWQTVTPATCEGAGERAKICVCGIRESEPIAATGHQMGTWRLTKAATCTTDGEEQRACRCGLSETRAIAAKGHRDDGAIRWTAADEPQQFCQSCDSWQTLTPSDGFLYTFHEKTQSCYVSSTILRKANVQLIPSTYQGYPVTGISFNVLKNMTSGILVIPASVTDIAARQFAGVCGVKTISVSPKNPIYLSAGNCIIEKATKTLISGCAGSVIPADGSVTAIGRDAFAHSNIAEITIPAAVTAIGEDAFACCAKLIKITVADGNPTYHSAGNCLIETATKTLVRGTVSSVIPADGSVTVIGNNAFSYVNFKSIALPRGITTIREGAFFACEALERLTIPSTVTEIERNAIYRCDKMTQLEVAAGNPVYHSSGNCLIETASKSLIAGNFSSVIPADGSVTRICSKAFYAAPNIYELTVPEGVTEIDTCAFQSCSKLTKVSLPQSLTTVAQGAFDACSQLKNIVYSGTMAQWKRLVTASLGADLPAITVHCTDGELMLSSTK